MNANIELVVFDLGRVLLRICDGWKHACEHSGVATEVGELDGASKAKLMDAVKLVEVGTIPPEEFCLRIAPVLGISCEEATTMWHRYTIEPYPGASELLVELKQGGVPTACLSNTNGAHWAIFNDPSEKSYFPLHLLTYPFASHLVRARKPDAPVYSHVERATGFAAASILFFDDVEENVLAARERGWHAHQVPLHDNPVPWIRNVIADYGLLSK